MMEIRIWPSDADPCNLDGLTAVIDVFRAFSMECYIFENNPVKVIPVNSIDEAWRIKKALGNVILIGEREGIQVPGFDYGNSPTEIDRKDFSGSIVVHTTTAGTRGLVLQPRNNDVITGSFVNAAATVRYIRSRNPSRVHLFCTAPSYTPFGDGDEDFLYAEYLRNELLDKPNDFPAMKERLRKGSGRVLREKYRAPEQDFSYCTDLDRFDFVLQRRFVEYPTHSMELVRLT